MKKIVWIWIVVFLGGFLFLAWVKSNETYPYEVLQKFDQFEVRRYDEALFTEVEMDSGSYKSVSSQGFKVLAGYIFGANERSEKIAMTTPVTMEMQDTMTMRFLVPAQYSIEELPKPDNAAIKIKTMPERIVAVVRFSGYANDEKIETHRQKLVEALAKEGLQHKGVFTFMGYNAPFDPINRRNEVMVELLDYSAKP